MNPKTTFYFSLLALWFCNFLAFSCTENKAVIDSIPKLTLEEQIKTKIDGEILPPLVANCFYGAYYRKAVSSVDYWLGIEGTVILPTLHYDLTRVNPIKPATYLDNASVYLGGTSDGQETDIGMTWEVIRELDGTISPDRKAFRPFLRRTAHKSGQTAVYINAPAESKYYWYPGDKITMSIQVIEAKKIKFMVSGAGKTYETIFDVDGYQPDIKANYKRVNAIDQVANEGKPVQTTTAKALGSEWLEVNLFRSLNAVIVKTPMHTKRFTDMRCPDSRNFEIIPNTTTTSGEKIAIYGTIKQ